MISQLLYVVRSDTSLTSSMPIVTHDGTKPAIGNTNKWIRKYIVFYAIQKTFVLISSRVIPKHDDWQRG